MAKLRKEMSIQFKLEHCSIIGSYLELQILDFSLIYMDGKLRNRPTMFMNTVRPKSAIFKFKVQPQKRSQNLSCNPAQTLLRILPISGVLQSQMTCNLVGGRKRQFPTTFMRRFSQIRMVTMTFHPDKSLRSIHHVHQQHYSVFQPYLELQ